MPPEDLYRWIAPLGWALLHFVSQGFAVAAVAWAAMTLARGARLRYAIGFAGMLVMLACPIATLAWIGPDARPVTIVDASPGVARAPARAIAEDTPRAGSRTKPNNTVRERLDRAAPALVAIWLVGVATLAAYHLVGLAQLARLRRRATRIVDLAWLDRVRRLSARLRLRSRVALLLTDRLDSPAVVGLLRPAILWPAAALTGLTPAQVEALLAHELAHVRRHDYAANLVQTLVETLLFYHPAVWWLSRRVRQEREHCCDDLAAGVVGDRATYASALAAMESLRQSPTFAISARGGSLLTRVQRLIAPTATRRVSPVGLGVIVTTLVLAGVFACRPREPVAAATTKPATQPFDDRIAVGDLLRVTVDDLTGPGVRSVEVRRVEGDGAISLPYVGKTVVAGRAASEAEATIALLYRQAHVLSQATVGVLVVQDAAGRSLVPAGLFAPEPAKLQATAEPADRAELQRAIADLATQVKALQDAQRSPKSDQAVDPLEARADEATRRWKLSAATNGPNAPEVAAAAQEAKLLTSELADRRQAVAEQNSPLGKVRELQSQRQQLVDALAAATRDHGETSDEAMVVRGVLSQLDQQIATATGFVGEYYVSGAVGRPGVYSLTARRITLMQALVSAGGAASAVPDDDPSHDFNIDVVRRAVADGKETRTRVRWSDVTHGKLATFYLLPNDQVIVGVDAGATTAPTATTGPVSALDGQMNDRADPR